MKTLDSCPLPAERDTRRRLYAEILVKNAPVFLVFVVIHGTTLAKEYPGNERRQE